MNLDRYVTKRIERKDLIKLDYSKVKETYRTYTQVDDKDQIESLADLFYLMGKEGLFDSIGSNGSNGKGEKKI